MKSLNIHELDLVCRKLDRLKSGQLQEIRFSGTHFEFGFWICGKKSWWHLRLDTLTPLFLPVTQPKLPKKPQNKPIYLFLKAHALGKKLEAITRDEKLGRVLVMRLRGMDPTKGVDSLCEIEMRLFPHGQNLIVCGNGKRLSMKPVKVIEKLENLIEPKTCRSLNDLESEFKSLSARSHISSSPEKLLVQQVAKLERAIQRVSQDLENKGQLSWKEVGEHLVQTQSLEVADEWSPYVDLTKSLVWNIENCFSKAKSNAHKIAGGKVRLAELQKERQNLKKNGPRLQKSPLAKSPLARPPLAKSPLTYVKARKMSLEGGLEAWVGRSASDNIRLLRQAKAWDIWVHLADHPSSYGIIRRPKGAQISHSALIDVGRWVVRTTFGEKSKNRRGDRFEILYTECRYVCPIKGDKVGRVTYRNEKVIRFKF